MKLSELTPATGVFILRTLSWLAVGQGQGAAAQAIKKVADGLESGANVDAHMAVIGDALKAGQAPDWAGVTARLTAASADLQGGAS